MSQPEEPELTPLEKIQANAELVIQIMREKVGVELSYDEESVKWIDGYIERNRASLAPATRDQIISVLGSFLGECIRRRFGGEWREVDGRWGIAFGPRTFVFPFAKVAKQFENGRDGGDSIYSLYSTVGPLFVKPLQRE